MEFESGIVHLFFYGNSKIENFFRDFGGDRIKEIETVVVAAFVCVKEDCDPMGTGLIVFVQIEHTREGIVLLEFRYLEVAKLGGYTRTHAVCFCEIYWKHTNEFERGVFFLILGHNIQYIKIC